MSEALTSVFGDRFVGINSISFSRGSVLVNSVVLLTGAVNGDDHQMLNDSMTSVFASNGFIIDAFTFEQTAGSCCCWRSLFIISAKLTE